MKRNGRPGGDGDAMELKELWAEFEADGGDFRTEMDALVEMLDGVVAKGN